MKKVCLAVCIFVGGFLFAGNAFAEEGPLGLTGFGVYGSVGTTMGSGVNLSLKWGRFPVVGLKYNFDGNQFHVSADYYVIDAEPIEKNLTYFVGGGAYAGINGDEESFDFGLRIPVGLQFWPIKNIELFVSPVLTIPLLASIELDFGAEFGVRVRL